MGALVSKRTSWALAIAGAAIILWLLADYSLPSQEICEPAKQVGQEQCAAYGFPLFLVIQIGEFLDRHNGLIIAAFTGTLWWSTHRLWKASTSELRHNENSSERAQRAYVAFVEFGLDFDKGKEGKNTTARPFGVWKNSGQTPATRMVESINWALLDADLPEDFDFPDDPADPHRGCYVVGPGHSFMSSSERLLTFAEFLSVAAKKKRMFVWSCTEYRDAFGSNRRTEVAAEMRVAHLASGEHNIVFNTIGRHNAMDADCMKPPQQD